MQRIVRAAAGSILPLLSFATPGVKQGYSAAMPPASTSSSIRR